MLLQGLKEPQAAQAAVFCSGTEAEGWPRAGAQGGCFPHHAFLPSVQERGLYIRKGLRKPAQVTLVPVKWHFLPSIFSPSSMTPSTPGKPLTTHPVGEDRTSDGEIAERPLLHHGFAPWNRPEPGKWGEAWNRNAVQSLEYYMELGILHGNLIIHKHPGDRRVQRTSS